MKPIAKRLGRDIPGLLNELLEETGFVFRVELPIWMASSAPQRSLLLATIPPARFHEPPVVAIQLRERVTRALDMLALREGGAPRLVASVIDRHDGTNYRPLAMMVGGPPYPTGHLERSVPDGVILPSLDSDRGLRVLAYQ